ncbi:hypothetical protein ACJX0J_015616 [Zea mays]
MQYQYFARKRTHIFILSLCPLGEYGARKEDGVEAWIHGMENLGLKTTTSIDANQGHKELMFHISSFHFLVQRISDLDSLCLNFILCFNNFGVMLDIVRLYAVADVSKLLTLNLIN